MGKVGLIQVVKRSPLGTGIFDGREVDEASLEVLVILFILKVSKYKLINILLDNYEIVTVSLGVDNKKIKYIFI